MTYTKDSIELAPIPTHGHFKDLSNLTFGRWKVLGFTGISRLWWVQCECGTIAQVDVSSLNRGNSRSCGCGQRELAKERNTTHNASQSPEYKAYVAAEQRCINPRVPNYHRYGGRGIRFLYESFDQFLNDVGLRPSPLHSLDRQRNNGNYELGNCLWATRNQQSRNRRDTLRITIGTDTKALSDWCDEYLVPARRAHSRRRLGWCDPCAVTLPLKVKCPHRPHISG